MVYDTGSRSKTPIATKYYEWNEVNEMKWNRIFFSIIMYNLDPTTEIYMLGKRPKIAKLVQIKSKS